MSDINDNPNISGAREFLRDYVASSHQEIDSWLSGASRETFSAELILISLEARKNGDAFDLSGIALASAMGLFERVEGGYLAAQKVVEHNLARGEEIPTELLNFLERPTKSGKQIGRSAKYARRDLLLVILLKYLVTVYKLPKFAGRATATNQPEIEQATAIGVLKAELAPLNKILGPANLVTVEAASLERATREFESKYPWF